MVNLLQRRKWLIKKLATVSSVMTSTLFMVVCFALIFPVHAASSTPSSADLQPFVGTWQAKFDGKVFQVVTLELKNGRLIGSVSRGHVELNDDGVLTAAELKEGSDPIVDSRFDGKAVILTTTDQADAQATNAKPDTNTFEMTLTGKDEATIIPVDDEIKKEMPKFKPWKLERVKK